MVPLAGKTFSDEYLHIQEYGQEKSATEAATAMTIR